MPPVTATSSPIPVLGDTEIWEIQNNSGGWFHPVHIHLIDFKVLSRNGKAPFPWELGPKDVIYTGELEKVRLIMKFGTKDTSSPFSVQVGKYMIHCHNLVHEDHDMMSQFSVGLPSDPTGTMVPERVRRQERSDHGRPGRCRHALSRQCAGG